MRILAVSSPSKSEFEEVPELSLYNSYSADWSLRGDLLPIGQNYNMKDIYIGLICLAGVHNWSTVH
jgi:hypothetical protein